MIKSHGYASYDAKSDLKPYSFERRDLNESDVQIEIKFCGICHSDIHTVRDEWGGAQYPVVPGHEIVGVVKHVGNKVKNFKIGDIAGVGCMVNSCGKCECCNNHIEQFCLNGCISLQ